MIRTLRRSLWPLRAIAAPGVRGVGAATRQVAVVMPSAVRGITYWRSPLVSTSLLRSTNWRSGESFFGAATRGALTAYRAAAWPGASAASSRGCAQRCMGHARGLKTKKSAAKRFIVTGKGNLKRGHAYKGHLTSHKSKTRLRKLNTKVLLTGVWAKKMKMLILNGK